MDESILESDSKEAHNSGMIKYIAGKPHPKGYFFVGALQCFKYTRLGFLIDLNWKWSHDGPGMGEALMICVQGAEELLRTKFVVISDSGYPASRLLIERQPQLTSSFICFVSTSMVSGSLRHLPEVIEIAGENSVPYVFRTQI